MVTVLLVPGFWLDGSSWEHSTGPLVDAGHTVEALTLPGKHGPDDDRSGIGLADHVAAVVARVDAIDDPVVLVGHSGGGAIIGGAVDRRPDRVARAIYVDAGPLADGAVINADPPSRGDEIPLPDWELWDEAELDGMDDGLRRRVEAVAVPEPVGVATEPARLGDERRLDVPTTIIASSMPSAVIRQLIDEGHPYVAELGRTRDVEIVDLPTGHWPQLTRPDDLGRLLLAAVERTEPFA